MLHPQGLSSNPFPELNQSNCIDNYLFNMYSNIVLSHLFPVGLPIKILKALLPSFIWLHILQILILEI